MSTEFGAKELSQADRREAATLTDQFGRKWQAIVDTIARGTCSAINPKNFVDRINTPQKWLRANTSERTVEVLFDNWIADLEEAHRTYEQLVLDTAIALSPEHGMKMYTDRPVSLMKIVGPGPEPVEPVKAARAGNKYCLGTSDKMPEWAQKFFVKPIIAAPEYPDAEDVYLDAEEEADPEATGGKRVNPRKTKQALEAA